LPEEVKVGPELEPELEPTPLELEPEPEPEPEPAEEEAPPLAGPEDDGPDDPRVGF